MSRRVVEYALSITALVVLVLVLRSLTIHPEGRYVFVFKNGYRGPFHLYERAGAPDAPIVDGRLVFHFDGDGNAAANARDFAADSFYLDAVYRFENGDPIFPPSSRDPARGVVYVAGAAVGGIESGPTGARVTQRFINGAIMKKR